MLLNFLTLFSEFQYYSHQLTSRVDLVSIQSFSDFDLKRGAGGRLLPPLGAPGLFRERLETRKNTVWAKCRVLISMQVVAIVTTVSYVFNLIYLQGRKIIQQTNNYRSKEIMMLTGGI